MNGSALEWTRKRNNRNGHTVKHSSKTKMLINFIKSIGVDNARGTRNNFKVASYLVAIFVPLYVVLPVP